MSGSSYEREFKKILISRGWTVFRSAGSLAIDLIALKSVELATPPNLVLCMLVEVKSFKGDTFTVKKTKRMKLQWADMMKLAKKFEVRYGLRMKGQKSFRLVDPQVLKKPYHWSRFDTPGLKLPPTH
jgi:Holliday junction resolvase